jgi:epoxyqueuosine reductase
MNKQDIIRIAENYIEQSPDNRISAEIALSEEVAGFKLFNHPLFAFGAAEDAYFSLLKQPQAVGEHFMQPKEWLLSAKSVISFFLPITEEIRKSNANNMTWPSDGWLHARIEGQLLLNKLCQFLKTELERAGYPSIVPAMDERFWSNTNGLDHNQFFTSNWSERHAAFVCGLGTFGLSKGLITEHGIAGRFGSVITTLELGPDNRNYTDIYEYCTMCGKCAKNCPVGAISIETGKDHKICSAFLEETKAMHNPRYACGKCQISVPCESKIPSQHFDIFVIQ